MNNINKPLKNFRGQIYPFLNKTANYYQNIFHDLSQVHA